MKTKVTINIDVPRSLYCSKQNNEMCDHAEILEGSKRQFCDIYRCCLPKTKQGLTVKCEACMLNLRDEILKGELM